MTMTLALRVACTRVQSHAVADGAGLGGKERRNKNNTTQIKSEHLLLCIAQRRAEPDRVPIVIRYYRLSIQKVAAGGGNGEGVVEHGLNFRLPARLVALAFVLVLNLFCFPSSCFALAAIIIINCAETRKRVGMVLLLLWVGRYLL